MGLSHAAQLVGLDLWCQCHSPADGWWLLVPKLGVVICTANHPSGGHRIKIGTKSYKVNGYSEDGGVKRVFEFHGDYWHGTPCCYPDRNASFYLLAFNFSRERLCLRKGMSSHGKYCTSLDLSQARHVWVSSSSSCMKSSPVKTTNGTFLLVVSIRKPFPSHLMSVPHCGWQLLSQNISSPTLNGMLKAGSREIP
jgi:hypothetical protein